ncbi:MAG: M48 family metallopeptidase [Ruminococcaceae bacterium]|nr:M48 family metallopeptidase [Oscillospiraceae bacterium]
MEHKIVLKDRTLTYELIRKKVKNVNLRIYPDGRVRVSASSWVSLSHIEKFLLEKQDFIIKAVDKYAENADAVAKKAEIRRYTKEDYNECAGKINAAVAAFYPRFGKYKIKMPRISLRAMKTRWGSCTPSKGTIRFNMMLVDKPQECVEYVVVHELAHLVHGNHSKEFWAIVEEILPDWKARKKRLNEKSLDN